MSQPASGIPQNVSFPLGEAPNNFQVQQQQQPQQVVQYVQIPIRQEGQSNFSAPRSNNSNNISNDNRMLFKNSELLSNNFQFQQQLGQIYVLEQQCLKRCNEWLLDHKVTYKITKEQVQFSTMLELEVFVVQTRNRKKQTYENCFKWGAASGTFLSSLFFYYNADQLFKGEHVFRITGISAIVGGVIALILSQQSNISQIISQTTVSIDFTAFELFFESCLQDIHKLRKQLVK